MTDTTSDDTENLNTSHQHTSVKREGADYNHGQLADHASQNTGEDENAPAPYYRTLPHNMEAEQGLLGAILVDNRVLEKIGDFLEAEHFFVAAHQRIFRAIQTVIDRGQSATPVTLKGYFETDEDLDKVGGAGYLANLAASVVTIINAKDYAKTIYDLHLRRELITLGEGIVNSAYEQSPDISAQDTVEDAESKLFKIAESGDIQSGFATIRDVVRTAIEIAESAYHSDSHITGVTTGLQDMDGMMGGMQKSDLIILAGRPSMGKTALATTMAYNAVHGYQKTGGKEGGGVGLFSLEMSSDQLATRLISSQAEISSSDIRKGNVREADFKKFVEASHHLSQVPLYIDDTPALSIGAVRSRARRLKRQHGLDFIVVDYLQLLRGTGSRQSTENRVVEVSEITRGLKAIAKELEVPVLALSQLSRAVEQREDKRPQLSDLRESGSIEQDADVVMFVYREEYYLSRTQPDMEDSEKFAKWQEKMDRALNKAEAIIAKQRHGPIGTVEMQFDPNFTRFRDLFKE